VRTFGKTYLIGLAAFLVVGALVAIGANVLSQLAESGQQPRPTLAVQTTYELKYRLGSGATTTIQVDVAGQACNIFDSSSLLLSACNLATFVDPTVIASDAHGALNDADTSALVGIIWRGRLDHRAEDCNDSGLLGERLARCRTSVLDPKYSLTDGAFTVFVGS
jgi:hypothetical protein